MGAHLNRGGHTLGKILSTLNNFSTIFVSQEHQLISELVDKSIQVLLMKSLA